MDLAIGELAARTGHSPSTLRYWESVGLLPVPDRVGGKRRYPVSVVDRIAVIDLARHAGFRLSEVRDLLEGVDAGADPQSQWAALVARKRPEVEALLARARAMYDLLGDLERCACADLAACAATAAAAARAGGAGGAGAATTEAAGSGAYR
ncbi:MAG TPA: MerR family transcriptional regulator [Acidimicrobiales bacterium]|nr:MerR family transcriptional regulator [Acidimicrobiales bacterium]